MSATPEARLFDLSLLASLASRDQLCSFLNVDATLLDIAPSPRSFAPYGSPLSVDARYAQ